MPLYVTSEDISQNLICDSTARRSSTGIHFTLQSSVEPPINNFKIHCQERTVVCLTKGPAERSSKGGSFEEYYWHTFAEVLLTTEFPDQRKFVISFSILIPAVHYKEKRDKFAVLANLPEETEKFLKCWS